MAKQPPVRAKCTMRSSRGTVMNFAGDIPTALEMGFYYLDSRQQREELLEKLTQINSELSSKGQ
ncbi:hypothetical protein [Achromobacter xylosoxidans]|uniref:hypothetical protein n=1 Tax=Alcaligenes xylosoxydans xylosoxydans TaxID=85698 RepID=UPI0021BE0A91|nr:hypothetical protein [Achromobacter xylosoxidans]UXL06449.1 hypothetical protein N4T34_07015 [Achromobacter xylosoxidans]